MHGKLIILVGPEAGREISLPDAGTLTIGRGQASDLRIDDPRISRVHCKLEIGPGGATLTDVGSTGGTFVAGEKISRRKLVHGEEIAIGESKLQFQVSASREKKASSPSAPRLSAKALNDLVGQSLGHFKLKSLKHTGGSSVLFLATDEKHSRPSLVKVMLPSVTSDEEQRSRFVRAVRTMINVRHDNLVEVYGAGKQGPFCWCAMEYVDGISILEMIDLIGSQGRLDWREVYRVAVHVARALECAHRNKVIHRNVTPENLLQRKNDKVVKLCDLMLAKALEGTQAKQVTAPGQLIGNVAYMSPERMIDTSNLDWRSDQYGLGATLFALLTGHPPFKADNLPALIDSIRTKPPAFPDYVAEQTNPGFQKVILQMLSKDPEQRFRYPSVLLETLNDIGTAHDVDADVRFNH